MRSTTTRGAALCGARGIMRVYHPGFGVSVPVDRTFLSDDPDTAVAQTIARMAQYAREDSHSPYVLRLAAQLRGAADQETIQRVWNWIRARVRFVSDREIAAPISDSPSIAEVLIRPVDLVRMPDAQEDCDGFSMLGAALFVSLGIPVAFVTVAADPHSPDQYSHVYLWVNGAAFDSSHGPYLGWEAQNRFGKRQLWSVETGMPIMRGGGSSLGMVRRGGLGDVLCPDGTTQPTITDCLNAGSFPSGGGGATATAPDFYQTLVTQGMSAALAILKARYAVPPPGTLITTRAGTIATAGAPGGVSPFGVSLTPAGVVTQGVPGWAWIVGGGVLLFVLMRGKR